MAEIGTPEWADRCRKAMQDAMNKERSAIINFRDEWSEFIGNRGWELLSDKDGKNFSDYRAFALCKRPHGLGMDAGDFVRHCEAAHQATGIDPRDRAENPKPLAESRRPTKEEQDNPNNIRVNQHGTSAEYLTARIARDRPDILEEMKEGKYPSVRAAAKAAGIVKEPTAIEKAKKAFIKLNDIERRAFLDWVEHDLEQVA